MRSSVATTGYLLGTRMLLPRGLANKVLKVDIDPQFFYTSSKDYWHTRFDSKIELGPMPLSLALVAQERLIMIFRLLAILLFIIATNVNAQGIPQKVEDILKQTMAADGYLTQVMHQEFWAEVRKLGSPQEIQLLKKTLNVSVLGAQEYQKELWDSAKISYENKRVVKTERLIQLERELPIMFEKSLAFPKGSPNYQQAMLAYKQRMKISMDNSARLLNSAAKRSPMTSAQGQVIPLDINMINTVLANLKSSFSRLQNLLREDWHGH